MEGMRTHKGFSKSAEGNLLQSCLGPDARTCTLVTDGSVGKQIGLFEVFLWFSQSEKIFWDSISNRLNLCDFWITNLPKYSDYLVCTLLQLLFNWLTDSPIFPWLFVAILDCKFPPFLPSKTELLYIVYL